VRTNDGAGLIPCRVFDCTKFQALDRKVVRFKIVKGEGLKPVTICESDLPDYLGFAQKVVSLMLSDFDPGRVITRCQEEVKALTNNEALKKKQQANSEAAAE
jgi:hypothetical protein